MYPENGSMAATKLRRYSGGEGESRNGWGTEAPLRVFGLNYGSGSSRTVLWFEGFPWVLLQSPDF